MQRDYLPMSPQEMRKRGWDSLDVILITGDAYVDHPAFGAALIGRMLEARGYRVGIIAQPDWRNPDDFMRLGRPRLFFGITSGNVDSMVANYTANKRPRQKDEFSPGGCSGMRPDRALVVYANRVRQAFKEVPVVLGGIEASMRRLAHYDYWDNQVRRSILFDARADILVYGMGETQVAAIADRLSAGESVSCLDGIPGTAVIRKNPEKGEGTVVLPAFEAVSRSAADFNTAFRLFYHQQNPFSAKTVIQAHGNRFAVVFPPAHPLSENELDAVYDRDFQRRWHPSYDADGGVPGFETVRHSLVTHRGCAGECHFCGLYFHQGRIVQSRSQDAVVREALRVIQDPGFRGTITDMGGPTANLYSSRCLRWKGKGFCDDRQCMTPKPCPHLDPGHDRGLLLYRRIRNLQGVNHAFISSGFRHDLLGNQKTDAYLQELCRFHISGRMKVAPEHICDDVLSAMGKPSVSAYEAFVDQFGRIHAHLSEPRFLVNYFISAHPGTTLGHALAMARYLIARKMHPEQIQDFIPLPLTYSGTLYHTEKDPFTGKRVYVAKTFRERKMHRALMQYRYPANFPLIREALKILKAENLAPLFFGRKKAPVLTHRADSNPKPGPKKNGKRKNRTHNHTSR